METQWREFGKRLHAMRRRVAKRWYWSYTRHRQPGASF